MFYPNIPLISVVLPVYNGEKYLKESIDSVLNQRLTNFELIIRDDGSSDDSLKIIHDYKDPRIQVLDNSDRLGIFGNLNRLILHSQAPYVHLWAQDDIMDKTCLENCIKFHASNEDVAFSFSSYCRINENGNKTQCGPDDGKFIVVGPKDAVPLFVAFGCIPGNISTVTLNKKLIENEGLFNEGLFFIGDFDMWVRLSSKYKFGKISKQLLNVRHHNSQASRNSEMLLRKIRETVNLHKYQICLLPENEQVAGNRIVKWLHQPHFLFVLFLLLRKGNFKLAGKYWKSLKEYDNIFLSYFRMLIYFLFNALGLKNQYRAFFLKPFKDHINNFY